MITAVRERKGDGFAQPSTTVVFGRPLNRVAACDGRILFFAPNTLVAFRCTWRSRTGGFVFRTLASDEPLARTIVDVQPSVRLLIAATTGRRLERALELLRLADKAECVTTLDELLLRAAPLLAGQAPVEHVFSALALGA
jgi:hypothetical protein